MDYVLYEFSEAMKTMYNTVEKPFKSLELSGNTKVNVLQESVEDDVIVPYQVDECQGTTLTGTKETGSLDNLVINGRTLVNSVLEDTSNSDYVSFDQDYEGQSFTINGTNEGAIKSAILTGQTLVNLKYREEAVNNSKKFVVVENLIENKQYIAIFPHIVNAKYAVYKASGSGGFIVNYTPSSKLIFTAPQSPVDIRLYVAFDDIAMELPSNALDIVCVEYQEGMENWDIPYFEGMQSVKMPVLTTTGKNLFDGQLENGRYTQSEGNPFADNTVVRTVNKIKVKPSTVYTLKTNDGTYLYNTSEYCNGVYIGYKVGTNLVTFTTSPTTNELHLSFSTSNIQLQFQLEEGSQATPFEPFKTNILTVNEDVTLRSNGDICDELNLLTGQLTQRIGKDGVVLSQEVVKTVDLNVVDQSNTKIDKIHVFDEVTHVNASSDELTPTVNIGKSVSYPTIIKPNTKYTVDLKRNDKPLTVNLGGTEVTFTSGETRKIITTPSTLTNDKLSYYGMGQKCSDIVVLEGEVEGNVDYFTGMQSVKVSTVSTVGKNVVNEKIWKIEAEEEEYQCLLSAGWATEVGKSGNPIIIPVHVEKGKVYTLKCKNKATKHFNDFYFMDDLLNGKVKSFRRSVGKNTTLNSFVDTIITFTADRDYKYLQIDTGNGNANGYIVKNTLQLEEGSIATPYEPYKSTILSCNEEIVLREVEHTQDTINLNTKECIQRISEIVLNGSEAWSVLDSNTENTIGFTLRNILPLKQIGDKYIKVNCDKLPSYKENLWNKDKIGCVAENNINGDLNDTQLQVRVLKSSLSTQDTQGFKAWLQTNPITIQYLLETPITKTVDLSIVDQDNITQTKLHTFNDTTHIMTSSDELTPIIKCDGKLEYPIIIKPSTQYTILANTSANGHALNNIAFDLGGTKVTFDLGGTKVTNTFDTRKITVTTPSTLTDNSLTITGEGAKVSELMVLEGNESDTLPYFEGMSSCKMPILHTVGKNLFDLSRMNETSYIGYNALNEINLEENSVATTNRNSASTGRGYVITGLKIGVPYTITATLDESSNTTGYFQIGNRQGTGYHEQRREFTPGQTKSWEVYSDVGSLRLAIAVAHDVSNQYIKFKNIQIEESPTPTTYEPHKSSILSCNDDVTLCGIGEVKDELNPLTSELTQHIKEFVLNGSESGWFKSSSVTSDGGYRYALRLNDGIVKDHAKIMCDKFVQSENVKIGYVNYLVIDNGLKSALYFNSTAETVDEWKAWLVENNVKVQYQLATESIRTVDLNVVDQDGNTIPKIKSYNGVTHLEVTVPKQSLLPHISAEVATDNSKDMSSLTIKHQEISETQSAIQDNIQSQSDEIDTAMMATTEIFESILE